MNADEMLGDGMTEQAVALLADLRPSTDKIDRVIPLPDCSVGAEFIITTDNRRLFSHVCDRRPSNPNRSARFRANAGVIRAAPELDPEHEISSIEPLTIRPSILCLDCGLHGFIRDGHWIRA